MDTTLGILEQIDIISSVSGGGYAAAWYYGQHLKAEIGTSFDPFADDTLKSVARKANFIEHPNGWFRVIATDFCGGHTGLTTIYPCLAVVYPWHYISSFFPPLGEGHLTDNGKLYADILERTYEFDGTSSTGAPFNLFKLRSELVNRHLPFLIFNATLSNVEDDSALSLSDRVFEFTPLRIGSAAQDVGYMDAESLLAKGRDYSLSTVVAISGAAVDPNDFVAAKLFRGLDLRYAMRSFKDGDNEYFALTDGGLVENLGAFALIRRQCGEIIVVDAEYDPQYTFEAYFKLNANLKKYDLVFNVPDIKNFNGNTKKPGEWHCPGTWRGESARAIPFDRKQPVLEGWTQKLGSNDRLAKIIYVKLSADSIVLESDAGKYGKFVSSYFNKDDDEFPQYPTRNVAWKEDRFMAIIDLGYHAVKNKAKLFKEVPRAHALVN